MISRKDWLLLALSHRDGEPMSPVQVQKTMFLMSEEARERVGDPFYRFTPYDYGPFDSDIYADLEAMEADGWVSINQSPHRRWSAYSITPKGIERTEALGEEADSVCLTFLGTVVDWVCAQSFSSLVRAIYEQYPAYKENSVFAG